MVLRGEQTSLQTKVPSSGLHSMGLSTHVVSITP